MRLIGIGEAGNVVQFLKVEDDTVSILEMIDGSEQEIRLVDPSGLLSELRKVEDDPNWDNDLVQFARLLSEINATFSEIDVPGLCASMDLDPDDIDALFERADKVFELAKAQIVEGQG